MDFRKLTVWQKAKDLAVAVYRSVHASAVAKDYGLKDQILRASVSIASNIAEGYTRETTPDRIHFLNVARGSCAELETQLIISVDAGLLSRAPADALIQQSDEVSKMLYSLREKLRSDHASR